jgi:hypothetical protein
MMLLPLLFLVGVHDWVPARWGSGDPKTLELLRGGVVNCLLLEAENWNGKFVESAAARHLAILGVIHPGDAALDLARRALRMKLNGIVIEGDFESAIADRIRSEAGHNLTVIELPNRGRMRLDSDDPLIGTSQALWPGIEIQHGGTVSTGPTSAPWINTNAGFLRFVGAATRSTIWLGERPPPHTVLSADRYAVAIADAAITGARWIVALDRDLEARFFAGDAGALDTWKQIDHYLRYFEEKREWREYRSYGELAIVEDTGSGGLLSSGLLDMLAVQHTAARALPTRRLSNESLHGARVVLNVDAATLVERQRKDIEDFANSGGKVVNPPPGWRFPEISAGAMTPTRREMDRIQPVWEATYNATVRKNFGARTFNTSSIIFDVRARPDTRSILVHLLNYTDYPSDDIALQVLGTWHRARLYTPDAPVRDLPVYPVKDGTGVDISRIAVLGTVVVE